MTGLLDPLLRADAMREIFCDRGRLQGLLDFEAALARAQSRIGVIPRDAAPAIGAQCEAKLFDIDALAQATKLAGNLALPMVTALTSLVAKTDKQAAGYVHWGATSQDAVDTGLVLQLRSAFDWIEAEIARLADALAQLADKHRATPMAGRTWLQHAVPVTFGLKAASALSAVERHRTRLREVRVRTLVLQFGGASGTLASLGSRGLEVVEALAQELGLGAPDLPWHAHRDRIAEVATTLGLLTGTLGKIAKDISLLMQTEIGEVYEPAAPGKGGSSTMPHKRNPVGAAVVLGAATKVPAFVSVMLSAMAQEHERGFGNWHAEWETLPEICLLTAGALGHLVPMVEGLEIDAARMRHNLDATRGLILAEAVSVALAPKFGRDSAHHLVEAACRRAITLGKSLRDVLADDAKISAQLTAGELDRLLDPANYLGASEQFINRVLAARNSDKQ
ncbi:MAG: 3-carboxy-cis,cis-muconate cycloisomerase [Betaproteobacteria bacterium]